MKKHTESLKHAMSRASAATDSATAVFILVVVVGVKVAWVVAVEVR